VEHLEVCHQNSFTSFASDRKSLLGFIIQKQYKCRLDYTKYNSSNLIDVFRYKLHIFFEFRICLIPFQMAPSLQLVVQCGSQTVLPFRFYKERVMWLIAGYCNPVSRHGNVVAFLRFCRENRDRWSSCI
jgi:hypothetical protein